jgi:hypothetical protein
LPSRTISQEPITMPKPHAFRPDALDHALENRQVLSHISLTAAAAQHNRLNLGQQQVGKNLINTGKVSGLPGGGTNHQTVGKTSSARVSLGTTAGRTLSPVRFANGLVSLNNGFTVNTGISNGLAFNNGLGGIGGGSLNGVGATTGLAFNNGLGNPINNPFNVGNTSFFGLGRFIAPGFSPTGAGVGSTGGFSNLLINGSGVNTGGSSLGIGTMF